MKMHFSNTSAHVKTKIDVRVAFLTVKYLEKNRGKDEMPARELPGFGKENKEQKNFSTSRAPPRKTVNTGENDGKSLTSRFSAL